MPHGQLQERYAKNRKDCKMADIDFEDIMSSLRKSALDPKVQKLFGYNDADIEQDIDLTSSTVQLFDQGICIDFDEADIVDPSNSAFGPEELLLDAFHFFSEGLEGYRAYTGKFIKDLSMRDNRQSIITTLGVPHFSGGGENNRFFGILPYWIKYEIEGGFIHFRFDKNENLSKATLMSQDV
jgi:hypothetical protein